MALVRGTNCGFVIVAPAIDPMGAANDVCDYKAICFKDISPPGANKITEIGWWCNNNTPDADIEVGLYSHDAANDKPDVLLAMASFTKGANSGWKKTNININIAGNTIYWLAWQLDNTTPNTQFDLHFDGASKYGERNLRGSLPSPNWGAVSIYTYRASVYAVWESEAEAEAKYKFGSLISEEPIEQKTGVFTEV